MEKESASEKEKKARPRSSIDVSSQTVCEDEACIGKIVPAPSPSIPEAADVPEKPTRESGTAMSFGGKQGCTDEACIGKT